MKGKVYKHKGNGKRYIVNREVGFQIFNIWFWFVAYFSLNGNDLMFIRTKRNFLKRFMETDNE